MRNFVVIVAGGKGLRMGGDLHNQFIPMHGKPLLMHTLEAFYNWNNETEIILVLPLDHQPYWQMLCKEIGCKAPHRVVTGGETRFHSVRNGLEVIESELLSSGEQAIIAVHDGVRPFVSSDTIDSCFKSAENNGAAVPVLPMIDSLREIKSEEESSPVDRSKYCSVQTPQVFRSDILFESYKQEYNSLFTDEASVVEAKGFKVSLVKGNRENIKITTPFDLLIAKAIFEGK